MFFRSTLLVASIASFGLVPKVVALAPQVPTGCGVGPASEEQLEYARQNMKELKMMEGAETMKEQEKILIPMYIHIVAKKSSEEGVTEERRIKGQVDALNAEFGKGNINFELMGWETHRDDNEFDNGDFQSLSKYQKGGADYGVLNLFVTGVKKYNGVAYLPVKNPAESHVKIDAAIITHKTFWGGKDRPRGTTAMHEIGHWLSLLHTFDGGCDASKGDAISDTPSHEAPTLANGGYAGGCRNGPPKDLPNTCPGLPGNDPIDNFMNYTDEPCRTKFTEAQFAQMRKAWLEMRAPKMKAQNKPKGTGAAQPPKPAQPTNQPTTQPKPTTTSAAPTPTQPKGGDDNKPKPPAPTPTVVRPDPISNTQPKPNVRYVTVTITRHAHVHAPKATL